MIIHQNHVLVIKRTKPGQEAYWVFPGGGVDNNETPEQAVQRECHEELGVDIRVKELFTKQSSGHPDTLGQTELFFLCEITGGILGNAFGPEYQYGTHYVGTYELVWIDVVDIRNYELRPNAVRDMIHEHYSSKQPDNNDAKAHIAQMMQKINAHLIGDEETEAVVRVLHSGILSRPEGGPVVREFQDVISRMLSQRFVNAVNSGTSALHLALSALDLQSNDEVIVPALANIADCSTVLQVGAKPIFADIEAETFNIDPKDVIKKITKHTKAVIVVHMYGQPVNLNALRIICDKHKLVLIEDCAQATGARYNGKYVGSYGDIICTSLYQTKHIVCGEGGLIATNNEKYYSHIRSDANNGINQEDLDAYDYNRLGFNYQLTDIQAAIAIEQNKRLDVNNQIRRNNANYLQKKIAGSGITFQKTDPNSEHAYFYLTGLLPAGLIEKRDMFLNRVMQLGIPIKKLYPLSLPEVELLKSSHVNDCPVSQEVTKRLFNLYVNPGLDREDLDATISAVLRAFAEINR